MYLSIHLCTYISNCSFIIVGYILYSFNKFWFDAEPDNIMAFSRVRDSFVQHLRQRLKERPLVIRMSLVQD